MTVLSRLPTTARLLLVLLGVGLGLNLRDIAAAIGTPTPALPIPMAAACWTTRWRYWWHCCWPRCCGP